MFAYTGREWDQDTELYGYRRRYYSPDVERFISFDPAWPQGGVDAYAYGKSNPLSYTDPSGTISVVGIVSTLVCSYENYESYINSAQNIAQLQQQLNNLKTQINNLESQYNGIQAGTSCPLPGQSISSIVDKIGSLQKQQLQIATQITNQELIKSYGSIAWEIACAATLRL